MGILFLDDNDMVFVDSLFCLSPTAFVEVVVVFHFFVDAVFFIGQLVGADPANGRWESLKDYFRSCDADIFLQKMSFYPVFAKYVSYFIREIWIFKY